MSEKWRNIYIRLSSSFGPNVIFAGVQHSSKENALADINPIAGSTEYLTTIRQLDKPSKGCSNDV